MPKFQAWKTGAGAAIFMLPLMAFAATPTESLNTSMQVQASINNAAQDSQEQINEIADETQALLEEYLIATQQTERLQIYNAHLANLISSQEDRMQSIEQELQEIEVVSKDIIPLMTRMIDALEKFVKLDLPFNTEDRLNRVEELRDIFERADVTISEKYRQIMDAYQRELEYGRTINAYRGTLSLGGEERQVDFLRVGRVLLAYQTLDGESTGFYNKNTGQWEPLGDEYANAISDGLNVARKQAAPELIKIPVSGPESAQ
ncbi:MAG TPA: DUF3450 domain-containing protein [Gammaproteobacteria bacterium]|nr:DUF3450 domain-containing protein [Gammaproteobacteria bacterium]